MIEEWRDIKGYDGRYQVSNLGRFVSITKRSGRKELKGSVDYKGYIKITLYKNGDRFIAGAHRIVAQTFIPNPDNKPQVNHIDGNKQNNAALNLEWCTNRENIRHKFCVLGYKVSTEHLEKMRAKGRARSVEASKRKILCVETGEIFGSIKAAVEKYGTSASNFSLVLQGKNKTACGLHWRYM